MATNEKPVFANTHTTHGGKYFKPGDRMDTRLSPDVIRHAQEDGVATDDSRKADSARKAEGERQADVARQLATRSAKREHNERREGNIPQLVRLPDGSLAEVTR